MLNPLAQQFSELRKEQELLTFEISNSTDAYDQLVSDNERTVTALELVVEEMSATEDAQSDLSDSSEDMAGEVKAQYKDMADNAIDDMDRLMEKMIEFQEFQDDFYGPNYYAGKSFAQNWGKSRTIEPSVYSGYGIDTSSIPALARGAVIPPNAPFTAVLGDQRNGYNLEGPEDMFRGIVREELEANAENETAGLLRQLIAVVQGINIGDTVIGEATNRYNRKMNTARGVW